MMRRRVSGQAGSPQMEPQSLQQRPSLTAALPPPPPLGPSATFPSCPSFGSLGGRSAGAAGSALELDSMASTAGSTTSSCSKHAARARRRQLLRLRAGFLQECGDAAMSPMTPMELPPPAATLHCPGKERRVPRGVSAAGHQQQQQQRSVRPPRTAGQPYQKDRHRLLLGKLRSEGGCGSGDGGSYVSLATLQRREERQQRVGLPWRGGACGDSDGARWLPSPSGGGVFGDAVEAALACGIDQITLHSSPTFHHAPHTFGTTTTTSGGGQGGADGSSSCTAHLLGRSSTFPPPTWGSNAWDPIPRAATAEGVCWR